MNRYQRLSRRLITTSSVIALLAAAVCVGLRNDPDLARGIAEAEWDKTFGSSDLDEGVSVQQTSDGRYIIAGHTVSFGQDTIPQATSGYTGF